MNLVSVIIPTYNCGRYLLKAINSVLSQSYINLELIIVDDGSQDNTKELVSPFLERQNIFYIYQENKGLAAARNTGIKIAKGEYIAFLDADDYWAKEKLEHQVNIFVKHGDVDLVHSNMYLFYEDNESKYTKYSLNTDFNNLSSKELFWRILNWQTDFLITTVTVRKTVFNRIGFFDEHLSKLGCEDREFYLRLVPRCKTYFINEYLAYYMKRSNSMSHDTAKMDKAREYVIEKTVGQNEFFTNKERMIAVIKSNLAFRIGLNYFKNKKNIIARDNFYACVRKNPLNFKGYCYLFLSFVPSKVFIFLSWLKPFLFMLQRTGK